MLKLSKLLILIFLYSGASYSQEVYHFTKGLISNVPNSYGREALYTDQLAYQLYTSTLRTPVEGDSTKGSADSTSIVWQSIKADSVNRLFRPGRTRGGFGRPAYIYLTYNADAEKMALLNIKGSNSLIFNGELHAGDPYSSGWLYIPLKLRKGLNEIYVRSSFVVASLHFPDRPISVNTEDATVPSIILNQPNTAHQAAVVVINASTKEMRGLNLKSNIAGKEVSSELPAIPPLSTRKIMFRFDASGVNTAGKHTCNLSLTDKGKLFDTATVMLEAVNSSDKYSNTFISNIDGSLQYYAVAPQRTDTPKNSALFLSVHGAGVEAIGQARAYQSKDWGTLVAATNRRPRGFNWEDWGRLDALEVLEIAKSKFNPDPQRIYLTGHSMGGHGTWFLGATYPDKWAAIAPCAGYPTLKGYGSADGLIPDSSQSPVGQILLRSSNQSDVIKLVSNYKPLGVYVFHGDDDRTVSVNYARQMRNLLGDFHPDLSYYEYPGGGHWFGDQSVDWKPIFDYFKWHTRLHDTAVNTIDFITASPGISSSYYWASIYQQTQPLQYSRIRLKRNRTAGTITGSTENIRLLKLDLKEFRRGTLVKISLDSTSQLEYKIAGVQDSVYLLKQDEKWVFTNKPDLFQKGPHRYGTLKEAFNHRMVFVYGTSGNKQENEWSFNKARYDAETWYYRGNGAVDIISDKEFSIEKYKDRGVILYGNKSTNTAWKVLLNDCPIQVERNRIIAGNKSLQGDDLASYFVWPIRSSAIASVGVISGTGIKGMNAANANQYFAGASGFPDFMIFTLKMLQSGVNEVKMAGFFDHAWKLNEPEPTSN
jgi:pimeloyl-ACP methyl ester carboxylesterase